MKIAYLLIFSACSLPCFAQIDFQKIRSINLPANITASAIDRVGELYVITDTDRLIKYDVNGEVAASVSLAAHPDIFDPRDGSHSFLYWKESQQYEFRLPDLQSISVSQKIDSSFAVAPFLVCPSGDHDIIILDSADWSLKKINTTSGTVLYETIIFAGEVNAANIVFMREYQNFIFILENGTGIHIFNRMGRMLRTIESSSATYFNFIGGEIYYPENGRLRFFDLFTAGERTSNIPELFSFALLSDERLFLIKDRVLSIYKSSF